MTSIITTLFQFNLRAQYIYHTSSYQPKSNLNGLSKIHQTSSLHTGRLPHQLPSQPLLRPRMDRPTRKPPSPTPPHIF